MLAGRSELIRQEIAAGTGAGIDIEIDNTGVQSGLKIWFSDLGRGHSPIVTLHPAGLHRYSAQMMFGNFARETISQMQRADDEEVQLARALVRSIGGSASVLVNGKDDLNRWTINGPAFTISAEKRNIDRRFGEAVLRETCREIVTPILAAMAELYGYDVVDEPDTSEPAGALEGAVRITTVRRRERNPRSRLLCLRLHGEICVVCGLQPQLVYGDAGGIIEVHHVQPVGLLNAPKMYDPSTDLIPLCPNCHRAVHTRRPIPWSPGELKSRLGVDG